MSPALRCRKGHLQKTGMRTAACHFARHSLISIGTYARILVIQVTVGVRAVIKGTISFLYGSTPPLVHEVPVETGEGPMLVAFVLNERLTLISSEFLQVSAHTYTLFAARERCGSKPLTCNGKVSQQRQSLSSGEGFPGP